MRIIPPANIFSELDRGRVRKRMKPRNALRNRILQRRFAMKVQAEIKNIQQIYELNPNQESYADFKIQSTSVVDEELPDAAIVETAVDASTRTTYALAALDREKISRAIAAEFTSGWDHANRTSAYCGRFSSPGKTCRSDSRSLRSTGGCDGTPPETGSPRCARTRAISQRAVSRARRH